MSDFVVSAFDSVIPSYPPTSSTVADCLEETRRLLYSNSRDQRDKLKVELAESSTSLELHYGINTVQTGSLLSINLEEMYVWEVTGREVTVERGQYGTSAIHHPAGSIIYVNPKFSNWAIFRAINNTIRGLSGEGLYRMQTVDLTWSSGIHGYDLTAITELEEIYEVSVRVDAGLNAWKVITDWSVQRHLPGGFSLFLPTVGLEGSSVRVKYKAPFAPFSSVTDNVVAISGVPIYMHDLIALGAAIRLAQPREIRRNFDESQGDTRRANEVPPGANLNSYAGLAVQYRQRVVQELTRLSRMYPDRRPRLWDVGPTYARRFG